MGIFTDLFSTKPAEDAARDKINSINTGLGQADTALDTGLTAANGYYGQADAPYTDLIKSTGAGSAAYGDATGANGAEGLARAGALFKSAPGYSGGLTTGTDQLLRTAAARGDVGGGNTSADVIKFASDYDANKYGNYVSALAPYLGAANSATAGNAGVLTSQAGANLGVGGTKANLAYTGNTAIGDAKAQADQSKYSASQNFWNGLLGVGKLAVSAATGMPTGGGPSFLSPGSAVPGASGPTSVGGPNGPSPLSF